MNCSRPCWQTQFLSTTEFSNEIKLRQGCAILSHSNLVLTHVSDRALLTITSIRHMNYILGKVSLSPYIPKITVAYRELRIYFTVQIPPFTDYSWDDTESASRSNVEWCSSHQQAITYLTGVILHTVMQWCGLKMCTAPGKCAIYTQLYNEHNPCVWVIKLLQVWSGMYQLSGIYISCSADATQVRSRLF